MKFKRCVLPLVILLSSIFSVQAGTWMNGKVCTVNSYYLYNLDGKEACEVNVTYGGNPYKLAIDMSTTTGALMYTLIVQAKKEGKQIAAYWGDGMITIWNRDRAVQAGICDLQIQVPILGDVGLMF